jgi:hypothetical protein
MLGVLAILAARAFADARFRFAAAPRRPAGQPRAAAISGNLTMR